jgi:alkylation response protein AidB-like acyl-CoA dehydrogenase
MTINQILDPPAPPAEHRVVDRESAGRFVDTHIRPYADGYDRGGRVPEKIIRLMSEAGVWAPFLPPVVGGSGMDFVTLGEVHEEFGRGCSSVRSLLTVHTMAAGAILRWGSPAQRDRWLPGLAGGRLLGAFCLTEPAVGSDATRISTTATRCGTGWVLNGLKKWITCGQRADLFLVFARTDRGVAAFLVPRGARGVRTTPIDDVLGTRASLLAEVEFREVKLDGDALLGPDGFTAGLVMTATLDLGRYSVAAGSVGIVQACLDASTEYSTRRTVHDTPLREFQLIQAKIADMSTDVHAGRLMYQHAGRLKDIGDPETVIATWMAKYFASTAAVRHASEAVQIHGANGCGTQYPVARLYRDAKVMEIIEGSTEIQRITIAGQAYRGDGRDSR